MSQPTTTQSEVQGGVFLNPAAIFHQLDFLTPGIEIADFGSGAGYFALPLARAVGNDGTVWAVDVLPSALSVIESRAKHEGIFNIKPVRGDLEASRGSGLRGESVDFVFIANVLYQARNRAAILAEASRILKPKGRVFVLEWIKDSPSHLGPPHDARVSDEAVLELAAGAGLEFEREIPAGMYHYGLLFRKA